MTDPGPIPTAEPAPRPRVPMPTFRASSAIIYVVVTTASAVAFIYPVIWLDGWRSAIFGALGALCGFIPFFAIREFRNERAAVEMVNDRMASHSEATDGFLRMQLDRAQAWVNGHRKIADDQMRIGRDEIATLTAALEHAQRFIPKQDPKTGKFIKRNIQRSITSAPAAGTELADLPPSFFGTIEGKAE